MQSKNLKEIVLSKLRNAKTVSTILMGCLLTTVYCQNGPNESLSKTKAVFGFGFTELLHVGIGYNLGNSNNLCFSAGILPLPLEGLVMSVSAEHRLYFGKIKETTNRRQWFCRQSYSYVSNREKGGIFCITIGKDLSKTPRHGFTADAGIQIPVQKESADRDFYGAIRIQYYFYLKKK